MHWSWHKHAAGLGRHLLNPAQPTVAPLADAVGLINDHSSQLAPPVQRIQCALQLARRRQLLGRDEQHLQMSQLSVFVLPNCQVSNYHSGTAALPRAASLNSTAAPRSASLLVPTLLAASSAHLAAIGSMQAGIHLCLLLPVHRATHTGGRNAKDGQVMYLVLDQGNERGHYNRDTIGQQCRQLVAQTLAATCMRRGIPGTVMQSTIIR